MEDLNEILTDIVQEKGVASLILKHTYVESLITEKLYFCPCKYCKKYNLKKDTIFCSNSEYECLTVSDECKEIQKNCAVVDEDRRFPAHTESIALRNKYMTASQTTDDTDWLLTID